MSALALDTSVAIPLIVATHPDHSAITRWWDARPVSLCGPAVAETYAVLTRLPGDLRLLPHDAARLLELRFGPPILLKTATARRLPSLLARLEVAGGATYDALVALAAKDHDATLATRDARARATYDAVGARVLLAQ